MRRNSLFFLTDPNNACHYLHPPVPSSRSSCRTIDKALVFPSQMDQANSSAKTPQSDNRARLVEGSFQGYMGHADGKPSDARFNHPKGVTMDDKGNVCVADPMNLAIWKISDAGVTTIAGGKSNVAGYRDGSSEDAKFLNDFDVVYIRPTCSL